MRTSLSWVASVLALLGSLSARAASLSPSQIFQVYDILTFQESQQDEIRILLMNYIFDLGADPRSVETGLYDRSFAGMTVKLSNSQAEGVRNMLSKYGLRLESGRRTNQPRQPDHPGLVRLVRKGNQILANFGNKFLDTSVASGPWELRRDMYSEYKEWVRDSADVKRTLSLLQIPEFERKIDMVYQEFNILNKAASLLASVTYDSLRKEFAYRRLRPRRLQVKGDQEYFMGLSPTELRQEGHIEFVEDQIDYWLQNMDPPVEVSVNPQTREVAAHSFLLVLGELESLQADDHQGLDASDIVDVLNRHLVASQWITYPGSCGPRCLELTEKLSRYQGLIPYLRLALSAKLGWEKREPPTESDLAAYESLGRSLTFEKAFWGGNLIVPTAHYGEVPLSQRLGYHSTQVYHGLKFINKWFKNHGVPVKDWQSTVGITLEQQRANLLRQRRQSLCEVHFAI